MSCGYKRHTFHCNTVTNTAKQLILNKNVNALLSHSCLFVTYIFLNAKERITAAGAFTLIRALMLLGNTLAVFNVFHFTQTYSYVNLKCKCVKMAI